MTGRRPVPTPRTSVDAVVRFDPPRGVELAPFIVTVPHSGAAYPADMGSILPHAALVSAEEPLADVLAMAACDQGAYVLIAGIGRAYLDVDRACDDLDPRLIEGVPEGGKGEGALHGLGLVRRLVAPGLPIYDRQLAHQEVERRIEAVWRPWHHAVDDAMDRTAKGTGGPALLVDLHIIATRAVGLSSERKGRERPEIVLADRGGTSAAPRLVEAIQRHLGSVGYGVARNDPWAGGETLRRQGRPGEARHAIGLAVRRDLVLTEGTRHPGAGFARLRSELADLFAELPGMVRRLG